MYRVLIHAVFEITISDDDSVEAQAIAEKLFEDDISSKSEMFSVRVERVLAKRKQLDRDSGGEGHNSAWGT